MITIDRRPASAPSRPACPAPSGIVAAVDAPAVDHAVTDHSGGRSVNTETRTGNAGDRYVARVLVQGNLSMSWHANLLLAAAIAIVCLGIAIVFAFFGLWLVVPFAGLEVVFVTACLYWTVRRLSRKEIITVEDQVITLEWGYTHPDISVSLPRHWSRLRYQRPRNPFDVGDLSLSAFGKRYALGSTLGREEKNELYRELSNIL